MYCKCNGQCELPAADLYVCVAVHKERPQFSVGTCLVQRLRSFDTIPTVAEIQSLFAQGP